ncbi:MAG: methyltransferase domain-containing protein [Candidatus Magasanikbacteria bacterium]|nr:methyltransferase domain-containing protein [Candidatus Magasanikbacteria bacterium]
MPKKIPLLDSAHGYDLAAPYYDAKEKFLDSFEKGKILPTLGDLTGQRVLDVGAGTGRLSLQLLKLGATVTALDISAQMLSKISKKNNKIQTILADAESLPFPNNHFDLVTAAFLIVHLKDPAVFFTEVHRVLKDKGQFLVTNINQRKPPEVKTKYGPILIESYYHRPEQIRGILEALAFTVEKEIIVRTREEQSPASARVGAPGAGWINQILLASK